MTWGERAYHLKQRKVERPKHIDIFFDIKPVYSVGMKLFTMAAVQILKGTLAWPQGMTFDLWLFSQLPSGYRAHRNAGLEVASYDFFHRETRISCNLWAS